MMRFNTIAAGLLMCLSGFCAADWQLDNNHSRLSLVTTKAGNIAEVHAFRQLSGAIANGEASVNIGLDSIDSQIEIRDQRMKEMLFETGKFSTATITAKLDSDVIDKLAVGNTSQFSLDVTLGLHGESMPLSIDVAVARLASNRLLVASSKPVIINAADFKLVEGVEKLRTVAGLPSISNSVPVSFVLVFEK